MDHRVVEKWTTSFSGISTILENIYVCAEHYRCATKL